MRTNSFKGYLISVYVEKHSGYSIGELYHIKAGRPIPRGSHVYGGNGTYVKYDNAEYIPTSHLVKAKFNTEVTYFDKEIGKKITKRVDKIVTLGELNVKLTPKQNQVFVLIAPIVNKTMYKLFNKEYEFTLQHEKDKAWTLIEYDAKMLYIFYEHIRNSLSENYTLAHMNDYSDEIVDYISNMYSNAIKPSLIKVYNE